MSVNTYYNDYNNNEKEMDEFKIKRPSFPPSIDPKELVAKLINHKSKSPKVPNEFFIYRAALVKELKANNCRIKMTKVSAIASESWNQEPLSIKTEYRKLARETENLYAKARLEKYEREKSKNTSNNVEKTNIDNNDNNNVNSGWSSPISPSTTLSFVIPNNEPNNNNGNNSGNNNGNNNGNNTDVTNIDPISPTVSNPSHVDLINLNLNLDLVLNRDIIVNNNNDDNLQKDEISIPQVGLMKNIFLEFLTNDDSILKGLDYNINNHDLIQSIPPSPSLSSISTGFSEQSSPIIISMPQSPLVSIHHPFINPKKNFGEFLTLSDINNNNIDYINIENNLNNINNINNNINNHDNYNYINNVNINILTDEFLLYDLNVNDPRVQDNLFGDEEIVGIPEDDNIYNFINS